MITVQRVDISQTMNPGITRFLITFSDGQQFTTIHKWLATLADHFREHETPVEPEGVRTRCGMVLRHLVKS